MRKSLAQEVDSAATGDGDKIDYILVTPDTEVSDATIVRTNRDGRYPSDHYPVTARVSLKPATARESAENKRRTP